MARLLVAVELLGSCWLIGLIIIHRFTFRFPAKFLGSDLSTLQNVLAYLGVKRLIGTIEPAA